MRYLIVICFLLGMYSSSARAQEYKYHTVEKGETVFSISQKYHLDEEDIYKYNPDAKEGISINEKLVIPINDSEKTASGNNKAEFVEHKVQKKETLYSLSKEYNVRIDDIKRFNKQLYSKELQMGETIRIPVAGTTAAAVATGNVNSNPVSVPYKTTGSKPVQDRKTREHIVLPKETKFGIARKYGMTVEELDDLNPMVEMLQPGMMIRVGTNVLKDEPVIITDERFRFYEVQKQETLFSLSQRFGVTQDSLKRLNPALQDGLKYGMVLKVPTKENPDAVLTSNDPAKASKKMDLKNEIRNRSTKNIAVMLPYHTEKVEIDSLASYKDLILKEKVTRVSLDFYSGILMAVEDAAKMGISTNLKVYDTKRNPGEVANILNMNDFSGTDVVIGPLVKQTAEAAASRLQSKNIPVISPLSSSEMYNYSNLFQARPTDKVLENAMLEYIAKNSAGKNIIVVADGKHFKVRDELSSRMPSARFVSPSDNFVGDQKLAAVMAAGPNWVILESDNINVVSSTTAALNRLAREHDITLLTTDKNDAFESDLISNNHLGKLKLHYPSVDKEYNLESDNEFIRRYQERFGNEPERFAMRGYDLTMDVLLRLASSEDLYESFNQYPGYTEYYENKFHYIPNMNGGFSNDAVYILQLDEQLNISEANGNNF
ncbi:PBP1 and LysM peptidoglycan-binding domain-containing protein [Christiangramia flava]|uniref:N-acetylmuramoyl-L-alanine amidase AmiB n=1 Tax=Christiangramia flava JLT2011 TaxID=1229726 RepID=A0A1L7I6S5_9FLAO|nr:LysM peptidoglycan-binding domain-containing protein [Christiangramia flava]APU69308.1 N-acetylmuramoyl-L-alanine amidase AmiB precursor [Christiangramia flava JLT2011]OSS38793.1 LysM-repeat protein [Christiangramia flava JLT2011]